jgi:hypothetical protein
VHDRHKNSFAVRKLDLSVLLEIFFIISVYVGDISLRTDFFSRHLATGSCNNLNIAISPNRSKHSGYYRYLYQTLPDKNSSQFAHRICFVLS